MSSVPTFPLQWPQGFPRSKLREASRFRASYDQALKNVATSLRLFAAESGRKVENPVLSSNIDTNPLSDERGKRPEDPGVAVWFTWDGLQVCIAVDRYQTPAENLQAVHHIIEARRVELRHGTLHLVRATFTGFKALPAPPGKHWRDLLKLTGAVSKADIEAAYRKAATSAHPDAGGSHEAMAELSRAKQVALQEVG